MRRRSWLTVALLVALPVMAWGGDWPQFLGPQRDGTSAETVAPWKGDLKVLWQQPAGDGHGGPIVSQGRVYVHQKAKDKEEEEEEVVAWSTDGKELWRKSYERSPYKNMFGNGPRSTPLVDGDRLYTLGATGILSCWGAADGKEIWRKDLLKEFGAKNLVFGVSTTPIVVGDRLCVMVGSDTASIVALDKKSGNVLWKSGKDKASYSSPILTNFNGQEQVVFLTGQGVIALNPKDGQELWRFPLVDKLMESSATPVRLGDLLWASSVTFGSVALRVGQSSTPEQAWKEPQLTSYFATPVVVGKETYLVTGSLTGQTASLHCIDVESGKTRWTRNRVGTYHATVIKAGDKLLLLEEKGDLVLIQPDAKEYKELARSRVCGQTWSHPALSGGRLYVRDAKDLRCVELPSSTK